MDLLLEIVTHVHHLTFVAGKFSSGLCNWNINDQEIVTDFLFDNIPGEKSHQDIVLNYKDLISTIKK